MDTLELPDQSIELDREKAAALSLERRIALNTRIIPALRCVGFAALTVAVYFYNLRLGEPAWNQSLPAFAIGTALYCLLSWGLLRLFFERCLPRDLGFFFLTTDLLLQAWAIYLTGADSSWLIALLLFRTADQVTSGTQRTTFFAHATTLTYALLIAYVVGIEGRSVDLVTESTKILILYAGNLYIVLTSRTSDVRRQQASAAIGLARQLIADLEDRTRELERARGQAEAGSLAKSQFLTNISHELRTPMNAITGLLDLLATQRPSGPARRLIVKLRTSTDELATVIDDLLDFSRLEADEIFIELRQTDPRRVVRSAVKRLQFRAAVKGLEIETDFAADLPRWVETDPARLRQVLLQLIDNAIKFSDSGSIEVKVRRDASAESDLVFSVIDQGTGFPDGSTARLFEPFTQEDASLTRRHGGVGLGLALSHRLVTLMGGEMGTVPTPGGGATVWFRLPAPATEPETPDSFTETMEVSRARLLVVEDNPLNQEVMVAMLESLGLEVHHADNGATALEAVREKHYDLILMDCQMPVMDGYRATREMRREESASHHTPIIAVTAHAMEGDRERCLAAGMDDFLPKPVTLDALAGTVGRWIEIR